MTGIVGDHDVTIGLLISYVYWKLSIEVLNTYVKHVNNNADVALDQLQQYNIKYSFSLLNLC